MEEEHQRRIDDGGGAERSNHDQNGASAGAQQQQSKQAGDEPAISTLCSKRKITDIYDESRLDGFVDDASAMQDAIKDVLDKASSPETSKKVFLRSQLQHLNKELVGIAEVWTEIPSAPGGLRVTALPELPVWYRIRFFAGDIP